MVGRFVHGFISTVAYSAATAPSKAVKKLVGRRNRLPHHGKTRYLFWWRRRFRLCVGIISQLLTVAALIRAARVSKRCFDPLANFRNRVLSSARLKRAAMKATSLAKGGEILSRRSVCDLPRGHRAGWPHPFSLLIIGVSNPINIFGR